MGAEHTDTPPWQPSAVRIAASNLTAFMGRLAVGIRFVRLPPDIHIFTSSMQPWIVLPPGIPAVEEYYDRNKYWPEESLVRRHALLG